MRARITISILILILFVSYSMGEQFEQEPGDCILIIGDSVPAGHAVTQVPGFGYPAIQTQPFTQVLDTFYNQELITHIGIYNLAVGAASLGSGGNIAYTETPQYAAAISLRCRFAVIFPWINDLPETTDALAAQEYIDYLARLISEILGASPKTKVVVLDYYRVLPTELGERIYGTTIQPQVIGMMNQSLAVACSSEGILGTFYGVSCLHIEPYLFPLESVLMRSLSQSEYIEQNMGPTKPDEAFWFTSFWATNPGTAIVVDGVHLNDEGKLRIARLLHQHLKTLDPTAFQSFSG